MFWCFVVVVLWARLRQEERKISCFLFFHFLVERIGCSHRFFASFSSLPCAGLSHIRYYGFEVPVKSNLWACNIEYDFCGEGQTRRTPALETYAPWHV